MTKRCLVAILLVAALLHTTPARAAVACEEGESCGGDSGWSAMASTLGILMGTAVLASGIGWSVPSIRGLANDERPRPLFLVASYISAAASIALGGVIMYYSTDKGDLSHPGWFGAGGAIATLGAAELLLAIGATTKPVPKGGYKPIFKFRPWFLPTGDGSMAAGASFSITGF